MCVYTVYTRLHMYVSRIFLYATEIMMLYELFKHQIMHLLHIQSMYYRIQNVSVSRTEF